MKAKVKAPSPSTERPVLKLKIDSGDGVEIPAFVATSKLTLPEIGALVCLAAIQIEGFGGLACERFSSPEMQEAVASLRSKGIVSASAAKKGDTLAVNISIDLTKVE